MDIARGREQNAKTASSTATFTGAVFRDPVLTNDAVAIATIIFEPGAHTYWHSHGDGQILFIDHGKGVVANRDGDVSTLQAADVMYAAPGEEHWHGAIDHAYLGQTTVSMGTTNWLEAVTPEQYRDAVEKALRA